MFHRVANFLSITSLGARDFRTLSWLLGETANSVMTTFAADPNPGGLKYTHFTGSAISTALRAGSSVHVVAPGETLHSIAYHYGKPVLVLAKANNIAPETMVSVGECIIIPGGAWTPVAAASEPNKGVNSNPVVLAVWMAYGSGIVI